MRITNKQVMESVGALAELQQTDIPAALSFRLAKIIMTIDPMIKAINAARVKLLDKYAKKGDDGRPITRENEEGGTMIEIEDTGSFEQELNEMMLVENDIDFEHICITDMVGLSVKPSVFISLNWLFCEGQ